MSESRAIAIDLASAGASGLAVGFAVSCAVAWLAMKSLLAWLNKHGLAPFGWYRLALAAGVALLLVRGILPAG